MYDYDKMEKEEAIRLSKIKDRTDMQEREFNKIKHLLK